MHLQSGTPVPQTLFLYPLPENVTLTAIAWTSVLLEMAAHLHCRFQDALEICTIQFLI